MDNSKWRYYRHAVLPTTAPHENVDLTEIKSGAVWKMKGLPFFARWTENFDCEQTTNWWYCIKDEPFEFEQVKSKRRTEIRKGLKNCRVDVINPLSAIEDIYSILQTCYEEYPSQYRPECSLEITKKMCKKWEKSHVLFVAYDHDGELVGFTAVEPKEDYVNFEILKVPAKYQKMEVTAALVYTMVNYFLREGSPYKYICDGERNLIHQTNFMEYLVDKFAFRYAYCDLKMAYRPIVWVIVTILYPFRKILKKFKNIPLIYNVLAVLKMEEIVRGNKI